MIPTARTQTSHEFELTGYFLKITISDFPDNVSWEELTLPDRGGCVGPLGAHECCSPLPAGLLQDDAERSPTELPTSADGE